MRNIFIFLLTLLLVIPIIAQEEEPLVDNFLFLFGQIKVPSQTTITHILTSQGAFWNGAYSYSTNSDWEEAEVSITGSTTENPSYIGSTAWKGFIFPWIVAPYQYTDVIAYGFYKVTNSHNNDYFYIDLRDCKYSGSQFSGPCTYYNPDFFIRFDDSTDIFEWKVSGDIWTTISTGELLNVYDIRNNGTPPTTSTFEDFWDHALVMTNNGNNKARIVWGPYPDPESLPGTITGYAIYRSANHPPGQPGSFSYLATVNADVFQYIDNSATIGNDLNANSYYVKAVYEYERGSGESGATNTVEVRLEVPQKRVTENYLQSVSFNLNQNYPNPFNPSTTIYYSIPEDAKVSIKVYDILGTEVTELVDEIKTAGYYEAVFNASNLSSGVYVYRITALSGDKLLFSQSKQMTLLK